MGEAKIGVIGTGLIGKLHLNCVRHLIRLGLVKGEIVAVCDVLEDRAEKVCKEFGLNSYCLDPAEIIEDDKVDTVFICTPTKFHKGAVLAAAATGKNIFCEKPLARNLNDAREMYRAVIDAGVKCQVGLVLRYSPVFVVMKELMSDDSLGRPMAVVYRDDQYFPVRGTYQSTWRGDYDIAGGGTLIEHSIHDIDLLRWFFGDIETVRAEVRCFSGREKVEDYASVTFKFSSGCTASLVSVWHNVLKRESNRNIEVFFENGYFATDDDNLGPIRFQTHDSDMQVMSPEEVKSRYLELAGHTDPLYRDIALNYMLEDLAFLESLDSGEPFPSFDVALKAHEVVESAYRSAAEGREVALTSSV